MITEDILHYLEEQGVVTAGAWHAAHGDLTLAPRDGEVVLIASTSTVT